MSHPLTPSTPLYQKYPLPYSHSGRDDDLKCYRPAPPWSTLNEHLSQVQVEEIAATERHEQRTCTIPSEEEIALACPIRKRHL